MMLLLLVKGLALATILPQVFAVPASLVQNEKRGSPTGTASAIGAIKSVLAPVVGGLVADASEASAIFGSILNEIENTVADEAPPPTSITQLTSLLQSIFSTAPTVFYENVIQLAANSLAPGASAIQDLVAGTFLGQNSESNIHLRNPIPAAFPKRIQSDPSYTLNEPQLRAVIYIPPTFTYGQKPPVILVPGTGSTGYQAFDGNFIPLLTGVSWADPVWLNIPIELLGDAQTNAEYVAYAINYIAGVTNKKVAVISWSQGGLITQWALKYWKSTRAVVSNFIPLSPDFHGTTLAAALCPAFPNLPCPPAVIQQEYTSNFVTALRTNGGDSAYVPTTSVYSSTDEIVEPQSGTGASGYLLANNGAKVTNNEIQKVCADQVGGTFYTHEGVMYSSLAFALAKDALVNGGPGQVSRLNLKTVCASYLAPGLSLEDAITTEESIANAAVAILAYPSKVTAEPPLMNYAK
jgi:pimeloyl-ACP methyl ester carboxylesterase